MYADTISFDGSCSKHPHSQGAVNGLAFDSTVVATASADANVRLFDVRTGQAVHTLTGHNSAVLSVQLGANGRVLSNDMSSSRVWDIRANQKLVHTQLVSSPFIETVGDHAIIVAADGRVRSMNLQTGDLKYTTDPIVFHPSCVRADPKKVVCGSRVGGVTILNTETGAVTGNIASAHANGVNGLQFDDGKLVTYVFRRSQGLAYFFDGCSFSNSGGADNSVKVWNFNNLAAPMYALLGGSLQARANNPPHPTRAGCSGVIFDDTKVIAVFNALMRVYNFEGAGAQ